MKVRCSKCGEKYELEGDNKDLKEDADGHLYSELKVGNKVYLACRKCRAHLKPVTES